MRRQHKPPKQAPRDRRGEVGAELQVGEERRLGAHDLDGRRPAGTAEAQHRTAIAKRFRFSPFELPSATPDADRDRLRGRGALRQARSGLAQRVAVAGNPRDDRRLHARDAMEDDRVHGPTEDTIADWMRRFLAPPATREVEPGPAPTFSVVVAAYQVADVIGEALDSIRSQTLPPLEVVVCDDGSTDDLEQALAPYRDEIVFLQKENGGEARPRTRSRGREG